MKPISTLDFSLGFNIGEHVTVTFDALPPDIEAELAAHQPTRLSITHNTVEMTVRDEEEGVLPLVTALSARGKVLRLEVNGASLEDIFVELTNPRKTVDSTSQGGRP